MKKILVYFVLLFLVIHSSAQLQQLNNNGAHIVMTTGTYLVLNDMAIANSGTFNQTAGTVKFTGAVNNNIAGSVIPQFFKLEINKSSAMQVQLQTGINISSEILFTSGLLNLNNNNIFLSGNARLTGESETSRIGTDDVGYVQITKTLNAPVAANPGNLGTVITSSQNMGRVIIRRGHKAQENVSGTAPGILRYYDILPENNAGLKTLLRFDYFDAELNGLNKNTLALWKQDKKGWTNVDFSNAGVINNYAEQNDIAFSRWTLSDPEVYHKAIATTSITPKNNFKESFLAWPNPVKDIVTLSITIFEPADAKLMLYDAKGVLIQSLQSKLAAGNNQLQVNLSRLSQGTYVLLCSWGDTNKVTRFIKL